jgi:hypothetical protein
VWIVPTTAKNVSQNLTAQPVSTTHSGLKQEYAILNAMVSSSGMLLPKNANSHALTTSFGTQLPISACLLIVDLNCFIHKMIECASNAQLAV